MHKQAGPYFPIRRPRRGSRAYRCRIVTRCTHVSYPRRITLPESVQFATNTSSSVVAVETANHPRARQVGRAVTRGRPGVAKGGTACPGIATGFIRRYYSSRRYETPL